MSVETMLKRVQARTKKREVLIFPDTNTHERISALRDYERCLNRWETNMTGMLWAHLKNRHQHLTKMALDFDDFISSHQLFSNLILRQDAADTAALYAAKDLFGEAIVKPAKRRKKKPKSKKGDEVEFLNKIHSVPDNRKEAK